MGSNLKSAITSRAMVVRLGAAAAYAAVVAVFVTIFPGETLATTLLYSLILLALAEGLYCSSSARCRAGEWLIFAVCLLLSVGDILNIYYFTTAFDSSPQLPHLQNTDAATNYYVAYKFYTTHYFSPPMNTTPIYRWLICSLWRVTGVTVAAPIFVNSIFIAWAVIFSGLTARNVMHDYRKSTVVAAMGMTAAVCYYLNSGTIILKDAAVSLAVAMMAFAFSHLRSGLSGKRNHAIAYVSLVVGGVLLSLFRVNYILPVAIGAVLLTPWTSPRRWHGIVMIAVCGLLWLSTEHFFPSGSISFRVTTYVDGYGFGGAYFQQETNPITAFTAATISAFRYGKKSFSPRPAQPCSSCRPFRGISPATRFSVPRWFGPTFPIRGMPSAALSCSSSSSFGGVPTSTFAFGLSGA